MSVRPRRFCDGLWPQTHLVILLFIHSLISYCVPGTVLDTRGILSPRLFHSPGPCGAAWLAVPLQGEGCHQGRQTVSGKV